MDLPPYPLDQFTNRIALPSHVEEEIRQLIGAGYKVAAVARVRELTGAGLKVSKDYVDNLAAAQDRRW